MKNIISHMQSFGIMPDKQNNIARATLASIANKLAPKEYHGAICFSISIVNEDREKVLHNLSLVVRYLRRAGFRDVEAREAKKDMRRFNIYMIID